MGDQKLKGLLFLLLMDFSQSYLFSFLNISPPPRLLTIAASDLSDRLTNEEIVSLVGGHISGLRGSFTRPAVLSHLSPSSSSSSASLSLAHVPRQEPTRGEGDAFVFEDANLATHLVRNALGGAKREQVAALLSIPAPLSRRYRDDVSFLSLSFLSLHHWLGCVKNESRG